MYGKIEYNEEGKPKCEICGKHFDKVVSHVIQKHGMTGRDYKATFGFDLIKGIMSETSRDLISEKTLANADIVIKKNLLTNGVKTQFRKGSIGRPKSKVSEETRIRLSERFKKLRNEKLRAS